MWIRQRKSCLHTRKNFSVTSIHTWHMGSRWYTSDSTQLPLTYKHLSRQAPTLMRRRRKKNVSRICSREVTSCFTSASVASSLPARCCLRCPKKWKSLHSLLRLQRFSHTHNIYAFIISTFKLTTCFDTIMSSSGHYL
jgi:hypothetical protein